MPHFKDSRNSAEGANDTLAYYVRWFADPVLSGAPRSVADIGAGYGWAAIALALRAPPTAQPRIVAVEQNEPRLNAAKQIATLAGVADRIEWCIGSLGSLPFADRGFDTVLSVEVVEHIGKSPPMMADLARIAAKTLLVTTPNRLFPIIRHDTALPFCHWLPNAGRDLYATLFNRRDLQDGNRFWSPSELQKALPGFKRSSGFLHFSTWRDYELANDAVPSHMQTRGLQRSWYRLASSLGQTSSYVLPTCAMMLQRQALP